MRCQVVDPRIYNVLIPTADYRVDFWTGSRSCEEWLLTDVRDVHQVHAWADERADGRTFTISAVAMLTEEPTLVRLCGTEPGERMDAAPDCRPARCESP